MIWRNHWFYLHYNRLTLRTPNHVSPFNALDEEVVDIVYARCISLEGIVSSWQEWWAKNRDKPFHIAYLTNRRQKHNDPSTDN